MSPSRLLLKSQNPNHHTWNSQPSYYNPLSLFSKSGSKQFLSSMISEKKAASAVSAKTARACDSCIRRRARWYCTADDAFLCQVCDGSVHAANPLARRHERVRLKAASALDREPCLPTWHRGPTKKGRTPRSRKQQLVVPEHDSSTSQDEGHEEEKFYRVPVYDPFVSELSGSTVTTSTNELGVGFDVSDFDMGEFGVDVETLLGKGLEGESYGIEELGLLDYQEVKAEVMREPLELNFNYESSTTCEGDMKVVNEEQVVKDKGRYERGNGEKREWKMSLRLDYDAISEAWANQGSPWMNGKKPNIIADDCWPQTSLGTGGAYGELRIVRGQASSGDGGREARVLRYREKRRTRLFSKKIRYEVRKLNAEKRPRMKGRFVKRSSFTPSPFPLLRQ